MSVELVPLSQIKSLEDAGYNLKEMMSGRHSQALTASIENFGQVGAIILAPRSNDEHPELAAAYGNDNKFIVCDGNKRLIRLQELGYRWIIAIPGMSSDGSADQFIDGMLAASRYLKGEIRDQVQPGEKVALGMVYSDLNTPAKIAMFVLSYDRARARYDEGKVLHQIKELIDQGEDAAQLEALSAIKLSAVAEMFSTESRSQENSASPQGNVGSETGLQPPMQSVEREHAERQKAHHQLCAMVGPFSFTMEQHRMYESLMDSLRDTHSEKVLKILVMANELGVEDDMEMGLAVERAFKVHAEDLDR